MLVRTFLQLPQVQHQADIFIRVSAVPVLVRTFLQLPQVQHQADIFIKVSAVPMLVRTFLQLPQVQHQADIFIKVSASTYAGQNLPPAAPGPAPGGHLYQFMLF